MQEPTGDGDARGSVGVGSGAVTHEGGNEPVQVQTVGLDPGQRAAAQQWSGR